MTDTPTIAPVYGPTRPSRAELHATRLANRLAHLRALPIVHDVPPATVDDLIGESRTLWTAPDARYTLAVDSMADAILSDDAWQSARPDIATLATLDPRQRSAALRHLTRDAKRADGIATDVTNLRRASKVGTGRKARPVRGGYVERSYSAIVSGPTVSAKRLASESLEDRAKRVGWDVYASDARHSTTLLASAVAYGHAPTLLRDGGRDVYSPTYGVAAPSSKLRHRLVTTVPSARSVRNGRDHLAVPDVVTYHRAERPRSDRLIHGASFPVDFGSSRASVAAYAPPVSAPGTATVGTVVACVGPWAADGPNGERRYWLGDRVVTVSARRRKQPTRRAAGVAARKVAADAVAQVLADRTSVTVNVLGRVVTIDPGKRGTVVWRTTTRRGQGKDVAAVSGRIVAAALS